MTVGMSAAIDSVSVSIDNETTGAAFVQYVNISSQRGLLGVGTIKNTGGVNSLSVKESVVDAFGTAANQTTVVLAGTDLRLDCAPVVNIGAARPPLVSYKVEVKHPVAATTFDLEFAAQGADWVGP